MREIVFRGKRIDNGKWEYGFYREVYMYYDYTHKRSEITYYDKYGELCIFEVIPETVGQYTGLKDKNGNKIYEGDVVMYINKEMVVIFDETNAVFSIKTDYSSWDITETLWDIDVVNEIEVIGNIHDKGGGIIND